METNSESKIKNKITKVSFTAQNKKNVTVHVILQNTLAKDSFSPGVLKQLVHNHINVFSFRTHLTLKEVV